MMINEAIVSGTPVIAYTVGVAPDLVLPGRTGLLAPEKTAASFADAIMTALEWTGEERRAARDACRELGASVASLDRQVEAFFAMAGK